MDDDDVPEKPKQTEKKMAEDLGEEEISFDDVPSLKEVQDEK